VEHDGLQCGYCTPGQIMSAIALIDETHAGSRDEIREWMSGNLCRCGAYNSIVEAIEQVWGGDARCNRLTSSRRLAWPRRSSSGQRPAPRTSPGHGPGRLRAYRWDERVDGGRHRGPSPTGHRVKR
jgi:hypothetical protein